MSKSLSRTLYLNVLATLCVSMLALGYMWVASEHHNSHEATIALHEEFMSSRKDHLRTEVEDAVAYVAYMRSIVNDRTRQMVRSHVNDAHHMATHLYEKFKDSKPLDEIKLIVKEALRDIRFNDGRGYYFALDTSAVAILRADRPELEGRNMLDTRNGQEVRTIEELISTATENGEGFYQYRWTKPGSQGDDHEKISYVRLFEPFGWVIGTGEYLEDMTAVLQQEVIERLEAVKIDGPNHDGYLFVGQMDGLSLSYPAKGKYMYEVEDVNGLKIVQEIIEIAESGKGGFLTYVMPKLGQERPAPKLAYIAGVEQWGWYIGTGAYVDDLHSAYVEAEQELHKKALDNTLKVIALTLGISAAGFLIIMFTLGKTRRELATFTDFFTAAVDSDVTLDPDALSFKEFRQMAGTVNKMVEERTRVQRQLALSEQRKNLALEAAEIGYWDWNLATGEIYFSSRYLSMLGYSPGEIEYSLDTWKKLLHPDDFDATHQKLAAAFASEDKTWRIKFRLLAKDGGYRWIVGSGKVVEFDAEGNAVRASGTHVDITQKKMEEAKLSAIVNSSPWGIMTYKLEEDGRLVLTASNKSADQILGIETSELVGKTIEEAFPPLAQTDIPYIYRRLAAEGGTWDSEQVDYSYDSISGKYEVQAFQTSNSEMAVSFIDISERLQSEQERRALEEQLQQSQKMEAVGTLAGGIAHDFNNILTAVLGYGELTLQKLDASSKEAGFVREIVSAAKRAKDLVKHILAFSRSAEQPKKAIKLQSVLSEALALLGASIPKTIDITTSIDPDVETIYGDTTQMHQVIMNLCTNAYHAMRETGGKLDIELTQTTVDTRKAAANQDLSEGPYARLSIRDSGPGIDEATLARIFEPYFTTKQIGEGTGMGLAVVHGIVKGHKGAISVKSEPGRGTTFEVYLPIHIEETGTAAGRGKSSPVNGNERILFVDDEPSIAKLWEVSLSSLGYRVNAQTVPDDALELFERSPEDFDIIITDQTMPGLTGEALACRALAIKPDIPVIICTGFSDILDEGKARELGIKALLFKPIERNTLATVIRGCFDND